MAEVHRGCCVTCGTHLAGKAEPSLELTPVVPYGGSDSPRSQSTSTKGRSTSTSPLSAVSSRPRSDPSPEPQHALRARPSSQIACSSFRDAKNRGTPEPPKCWGVEKENAAPLEVLKDETQVLRDTQIGERCAICLEPCPHDSDATLQLACGHAGCSACLRQYVTAKVRDGEVLERQLVCPFAADCKRPVDIEVLRMAPNFPRLLQLRAVRWRPAPESGLVVVYCGTPRCPPFLVTKPETREALACPTCSREYCSSCQGDWHEKGACHTIGREAWVQSMAKKQGWTGCPVCGMIVEKRGGCNFITCTSARCNGLVFFCYLCGEEVDSKAHNSQEHFTDGPFGSRCIGMKSSMTAKSFRARLTGTRVCTIL